MSSLPQTPEDILATGIMDPEFEAAWKARGSPPGDMPAEVPTLKRLIDEGLPRLQSQLAASRPANITETEHTLPLATGFTARLLICHTTHTQADGDSDPKPSPIILLFHGGIHVLGHPEFDLPLARRLALAHDATVVCASPARKAPEHPFPAMLHDAWATLQAVAHDAATTTPPTTRSFLPARADARRAGFLVGGTSSGANFADVVAHLARDAGLSPPLTGSVLVCGGFMDGAEQVPPAYAGMYLSREQNRDAPVVNAGFLKAFREAVRPEVGSALWAPFVQGHPEGVAAGHRGMPPVYFQVCGMDGNRDDGLVYERVLREECGVPTRVDLYRGLPHCWWDMYPDLEVSKKRLEDMIAGVGWLLGQEKGLEG
jgi:acetyl esterase/lipase